MVGTGFVASGKAAPAFPEYLPAKDSALGLHLIGGAPAPGAGAEATGHDPLAIDVRNRIAVAGEQRLGRAHLGAERQLALGQPIAAILLELGRGVVFLRAACAEGTLVHLAAAAEVARLRIDRKSVE